MKFNRGIVTKATNNALNDDTMNHTCDIFSLESSYPRLFKALEQEEWLSVDWDPKNRYHGTIMLCNPSVNVLPGRICNEVVAHYTSGNCPVFAWAFKEEVPESDLVILLDKDVSIKEADLRNIANDLALPHVAVQLPNGSFVDIEGVHDQQGFLSRWESKLNKPLKLHVVNEDDATILLGGNPDDIHEVDWEMARTYVMEILSRYDESLPNGLA